MKKYVLIGILVGLVSIGTVIIYKFPKEINWAKKHLVKKERYRHQKITNPIRDNIPKNSSDVVFGLDLSHHQRTIDWSKLAQNPPHFIIFKTTEGSTHVDTKYHQHKKEARKQKIMVGGYHFFSYQSAGKSQAKYFIKHLNLQKRDIIPVLDVEFTKNMKSDVWIKENIKEFIEVIENEFGVKPIIYCEIAYYNRFLKPLYGDELLLWLSDFRKKPKNQFAIWQKTDKYKQLGIKGTVDYNIFNGTKSDLKNIFY